MRSLPLVQMANEVQAASIAFAQAEARLREGFSVSEDEVSQAQQRALRQLGNPLVELAPRFVGARPGFCFAPSAASVETAVAGRRSTTLPDWSDH